MLFTEVTSTSNSGRKNSLISGRNLEQDQANKGERKLSESVNKFGVSNSKLLPVDRSRVMALTDEQQEEVWPGLTKALKENLTEGECFVTFLQKKETLAHLDLLYMS